MGWKKGNPGCPCCTVCEIDAFTSEQTIEDANTSSIRAAEHPQSPYPAWLQLEITVENGAIGVAYLLWDDATPGDGIYIEFTPDMPDASSGSVSVYTKDDTRIAGPWRIAGAVSDEWHRLTICYDPDLYPEQMVITVEPTIDTTPGTTQRFNVTIPDTMTVGRQAGYGTGNGSGAVSVRNYSFDRLWYCGDGTQDCQTYAGDWDYYNELPTRTYCHECSPCPDGETLNLDTTSPDQEQIGTVGQSGWHTIEFSIFPPGEDEAIVGVSDILGYNKLYLLLKCTGGPDPDGFGYFTPNIFGGFYYDEGDGVEQLYFWIEFLTQNTSSVETVVYEVFKVENGGAPTSILGPASITGTSTGTGYYYGGDDDLVAIHAPMRKLLIGTGAKTETADTSVEESFDECQCYGTEKPRKYTVTVAGVTAGSLAWDLTLLNRAAITLKNYHHTDPSMLGCTTPPLAWTQPTIQFGNCCGTNWEATTSPVKFKQTTFTAYYSGESTVLIGFAYAYQIIGGSLRIIELRFYRSVFGRLDIRELNGYSIPFVSMLCQTEGFDCTDTCDWVDASSATMTITAVV